MNTFSKLFKMTGDQRGVAFVLVALAMVVVIGFAALAIDTGHLFVVRNELQNAADSGALAGARALYLDNGKVINTLADTEAHDAAVANTSEKLPVEIDDGDIQRGHWSFGLGTLPKGFYPNNSTTPLIIANYSGVELDQMEEFINAVRVRTRRGGTSPAAVKAASFFARIFGYEGFSLSAEAVGYIGFLGSLLPGEADAPIAICEESIRSWLEPGMECGVGRMINSGSNSGHQTGGWTNFTQDPDPGCTTASTPTVRPYVDCKGNQLPSPMVFFAGPMGTTGGMVQTIYDDFIYCWKVKTGMDPNDPNFNNTYPTTPLTLTLPVISCPGNNVGPCSTVVGAVQIWVVWITRTGVKNSYDPVPKEMFNPKTGKTWTCSTPADNHNCWAEFVEEFQLKDVLNNSPAFLEDKTIYFLPNCEGTELAGTTGGKNFGVLSKIPVLVK